MTTKVTRSTAGLRQNKPRKPEEAQVRLEAVKSPASVNKLLTQTHFSARDVLEVMGVQNPGMMDVLRVTAALCAHTPEADTYSERVNSEGYKVRTPLDRPYSLSAVRGAAFDMGVASLLGKIRDAEGELRRLAESVAQ
jgi:hypothetical protein